MSQLIQKLTRDSHPDVQKFKPTALRMAKAYVEALVHRAPIL